jgi:mono/diheme cytochrome c family protein
MRYAVSIAVLCSIAPASVATAQTMPPAYRTNCQMCHQATGKGVPGQFPRLAGRVDKIAASPDGRNYLIAALLFGQIGKIMVDGKPVMGFMAPFARLTDRDIAGTLNYLVALGPTKAKAFTPADIAVVRNGPKLNPTKVHEMREALASAGKIP